MQRSRFLVRHALCHATSRASQRKFTAEHDGVHLGRRADVNERVVGNDVVEAAALHLDAEPIAAAALQEP